MTNYICRDLVPSIIEMSTLEVLHDLSMASPIFCKTIYEAGIRAFRKDNVICSVEPDDTIIQAKNSGQKFLMGHTNGEDECEDKVAGNYMYYENAHFVSNKIWAEQEGTFTAYTDAKNNVTMYCSAEGTYFVEDSMQNKCTIDENNSMVFENEVTEIDFISIEGMIIGSYDFDSNPIKVCVEEYDILEL